MAPSWWNAGAIKGYTAAQKASLKAADAMLRESRSRSFEAEYEPLSSLGSGGAATVARCVHRASGAVVAAKRIPLGPSPSPSPFSSASSSSSPSGSAREAALVELASLILLQGAPHAIELLDAIEEKKSGDKEEAGRPSPTSCVFLVTRLCAGGELFDSIVAKEHYCEREAALVVRSLASYLAAAHRVGVVHRDLKPENVLLLASGSSSKSSSPTKAAAAAATWPAPPTTLAPAAAAAAAVPLERLPSRLCREASDVAAMLSACPPMRPSSLSGGERIGRRRATGTGAPAGTKEVALPEEGGEEGGGERALAVASAGDPEPAPSSSSIEGRRRCSCLEREGIRVIDLGCAALFDPSLSSSAAAAAAAAAERCSSSSASALSPSRGQPARLRKMVGTPYYAAPEVLPDSPFPLSGAASDVWSLGVIAFVLLSGRPPFGGRDDAEVARRVAVGRFSFRGRAWEGVSDAAKAAISSMLEKDPSKRATAAQVLESEWLLSSEKKTAREEEEEEEEESAAAVATAVASLSSSSSSSTRLRARIRAFAAESKLHAVAALALTRTVSGAEGAAQLRDLILLQEEGSSGEEESEEGEEEEEGSDDGGNYERCAPRLGVGGAAVAPSRKAAHSSSYRCSAPGGFEGGKKDRSAPGAPRAAPTATGKTGGGNKLGGLLRRTLTLGTAASAANAAAALAAAAAALPPGCRECETCGGIVVEEEEEEEGEEKGGERGKEGAEAFLEGLLERGGNGEESQPPSNTLLRTQTIVGAERAAELAFAALDADGDGWLCVEDLLRAGRGEEGGGEGNDDDEKKKRKKKNGSSSLMTREEALACIDQARRFDETTTHEFEDRMDFAGFKRVLWRRAAEGGGPESKAAA